MLIDHLICIINLPLVTFRDDISEILNAAVLIRRDTVMMEGGKRGEKKSIKARFGRLARKRGAIAR